jgi:hypothetical protein
MLYALGKLQPDKGVEFVCKELLDKQLEFNRRYAALRALRWLIEDDSVIDRERVFGCLVAGLDQSDIADLYMEDLRINRRWEAVDKVLAPRPADDPAIVRRAQLRFALCCSGQTARDYVARARQANAERVAEAEELLALERQPAPQPVRQFPAWFVWANIWPQ